MEESLPRKEGVSMDELNDEEADLPPKLALRSPMEEAVAELATEASLPLSSPTAPVVEHFASYLPKRHSCRR
jgi:hypothetical protein